MKKTHRRKLFTTAMAYLFLLGSVTLPQNAFAAASGNYTDLLPIGAAENTTVISRGSGWALTTLPATQTFGDALSRVVTTVYQSTSTANVNATTTVSTLTAISGQGSVGSTTYPSAWVATGRSIEVEIRGVYSVPAAANENATLTVKLGTTTILNTGAIAFHAGESNSPLIIKGLLTIGATGTSGTAVGQFDVFASSSGTMIWNSTNTLTGVSVDLASQLTVNPTWAWATGASSMTVTNAIIKMLN